MERDPGQSFVREQSRAANHNERRTIKTRSPLALRRFVVNVLGIRAINYLPSWGIFSVLNNRNSQGRGCEGARVVSREIEHEQNK